MIIALEKTPIIADDAWIAPQCTIIGSVTLSSNVSIWFGSTIRGDNEPILIETGSNIQDGCILHNDHDFPLSIGSYTTVGHGCILHGCQIGDECIIGMGSIIMNGAVIGQQCLVGAGTLITEGAIIPDGSLVIGRPGKVIRPLTTQERCKLKQNALLYIQKKMQYVQIMNNQ